MCIHLTPAYIISSGVVTEVILECFVESASPIHLGKCTSRAEISSPITNLTPEKESL